MRPLCPIHDMPHDRRKRDECGDMLRAEKAERRQRVKVAAAEKIATSVIVAEHRRDGEWFPRDWDDVQRLLTAAALRALNGEEKDA